MGRRECGGGLGSMPGGSRCSEGASFAPLICVVGSMVDLD
jgi:hypothetical protein